MSTHSVTTLFAVLAVIAEVTTVGILALGVIGARVESVAAVRDRVWRILAPNGLWLAAVVALVCTLGSLYLSERAHFPPCRLCWFQRIAMYPLVVVLGLAAFRRDRGARIYGIALASIGAAISCWHLLVERYPTLEGDSCDPLNPCSIIWVQRFGYLTIPAMALSGFALIIALCAIARPKPRSLESRPSETVADATGTTETQEH